MKNFSSYRAHKVKLLHKMRKISINLPFFFFLAIIEFVRELLISNMYNKFDEDT